MYVIPPKRDKESTPCGVLSHIWPLGVSPAIGVSRQSNGAFLTAPQPPARHRGSQRFYAPSRLIPYARPILSQKTPAALTAATASSSWGLRFFRLRLGVPTVCRYRSVAMSWSPTSRNTGSWSSRSLSVESALAGGPAYRDICRACNGTWPIRTHGTRPTP